MAIKLRRRPVRLFAGLMLLLTGVTDSFGQDTTRKGTLILTDPSFSIDGNSIIISAVIRNTSTDTVLLYRPYLHTKGFVSCTGCQYTDATASQTYLTSNYWELPNEEREAEFNNFCRSYIEPGEILLLYPGDSLLVSEKRWNLLEGSTDIRDSYTGYIHFSSPKELIDFCPRIWTGRLSYQGELHARRPRE